MWAEVGKQLWTVQHLSGLCGRNNFPQAWRVKGMEWLLNLKTGCVEGACCKSRHLYLRAQPAQVSLWKEAVPCVTFRAASQGTDGGGYGG